MIKYTAYKLCPTRWCYQRCSSTITFGKNRL